ncbi:DUF3817 domain-containing protein [Bacillus swezeyi]|uniref:DUF3817 domain-containing protein n=1 Tax=Bacillus swezeyi TaxID=1925020 RepID=A0A5M8RNB8_9BACI|nr:DUF3817 domain-containing protein [Bacillus swezeyi]KAA6449609.1 DUF3817 domain-containing protein [Bacillus swezeyi]KAA6474381.1 DUF3817 domain-containing protein [Bacillus swezeyi]TYS33624.1 DUF3817 domain-containing protein [Bacillus swezeyi]
MLQTPIGRLRTMGFIEGMSLLILLFVAMPLKYWAGYPMAVTIVGSLHGGLFILYLLVLLYATFVLRWSLKWPAAGLIVAFVPFGNFLYDRGLKKYDK